MSLLHGKRALVCGASQGIGRACAVQLASLGAQVTLAARDPEALRTAAEELPVPTGTKHGYFAADFANPMAVRSQIALFLRETGGVQILVNNTGGPPHGVLLDAEPEQLSAAFAQHVLCNQELARAVVPGMRDAGYGRIINIISTSVLIPIRGLGVSNTTRGAVANWGRTLAAELAPWGITVNNVLPGYTATARLQSLFSAKAHKAGISTVEIEKQVIASIPMQRLADPAEIGAVVAFLATPAASYITGVNLPVDGGRTAVQ